MSSSAFPTRVVLALWAAILGVGGLTFAAALPRLSYSPDSWSYWELSQTFAGSFYRLTTWRAFQDTVPFSTAFPPLWPALNALGAAALGTGPTTLLWMNGVVLVGFAAASAWAGAMVFGRAAVGLVAVLLTLEDQSWLDELLKGRSIPLQMTLLALLLALLGSGLQPARRFGLAGLVCGLLVANRFDAVPFAATIAALLLLTPDRRWLPVFAIAAAVPALPWVIYSLAHFGTVFATDSRLVAMSTDPTAFVTDWRPAWAPLMRDDPLAWLRKLRGNLPVVDLVLRTSWDPTQRVALALGGGAAALALLWARRRGIAVPWRHLARPGFAVLAVGLGLAAVLPSLLATGYADARYLAPLRWLAGFVGIGLVWCSLAWLGRPGAAQGVLLALGLLLTGHRAVALIRQPLAVRPDAAFAQPARYPALLSCLDRLPPATLMVLDDDADAARFGALTHRPTAMLPRNLLGLPDSQRQAFLHLYRIGTVAWSGSLGEERARVLGARRVPGCDGVGQLDLPAS